jgi:tellurite methyltransferase
MSEKPFWEATYSRVNAPGTFGEPATELAWICSLLPSGATVLDLGCGEGRNALYLAAQGCDVTAIDISHAGIEKLKHHARERALSIRAEVRDMRGYIFDRDYDLIVAHGSLHLIERDDWASLIHRARAHTVAGGYNLLVLFTDTLPPPDDLKDFHIGLFREGEVFEFYNDWEILLRESYILEDEHPGGIRHRHPINKLVARKVSGRE